MSTQEDREEKVTGYLAQLKKSHSDKFIPMQYRISSEMRVSGIHTSLDEPPSNSMFKRASKNASESTKSKKAICLK